MNLYIFNEKRRGAVFGIGTYIRELTYALKNSEINICVVNLTSDKPQIQSEEIDGIRYWHFPAPINEQLTADSPKQQELYFRNIVYLFQLHIQDKKDLIFHLNYYESGQLAEELKNAFECKIVAVAHFCGWGFTVFDNLPRLRYLLNEEKPDCDSEKLKKSFEQEKYCYSKADHVICLSKYMKEILCQDYGIDIKKTSVIPNGILDMTDTKSNRKLLRKKWMISSEEKIILFAGRIDKIKGLSFLIQAFRTVLRKFPNCRLMIAGSGNYDMYFQNSNDICTKMTFTGLLEKKQLYELYKIADVGVVLSLFEPFGYVAVEMMMHKLPIVVTATSGLNEVVDEVSGIKIPVTVLPDSVEINTTLLAKKILYLLQNPIEAKCLGEIARKRYLKEYSSPVFGNKMISFYRSLFLID